MRAIVAFLLCCLVYSARSQTPQHRKAKALYCNADSITKWGQGPGKEAITEFVFSGIQCWIVHDGKNYIDTSYYPPVERLTNIGDTSIDEGGTEEVPVIIYITKCAICEPYIVPAYKHIHHEKYFIRQQFRDIRTGKIYTSGNAYEARGHIWGDIITYTDRNRNQFDKSIKIWGESK